MDRARNRRCSEHPLQVDLVFTIGGVSERESGREPEEAKREIHREFSSQPAQ